MKYYFSSPKNPLALRSTRLSISVAFVDSEADGSDPCSNKLGDDMPGFTTVGELILSPSVDVTEAALENDLLLPDPFDSYVHDLN